MFKAIVGAAALRDMLDSVSVLVDECKIRLSEEGLLICAVDPANIGMVDLTLDAAVFESYEAHSGIISVSLSRLEEVAGMAGTDNLIHLTLDGETHELNIRIDGLSHALALIDPDSVRQEPDTPNLNLAASIVLEGTYLDCGIKAANMVLDHIRLRVDGVEETFRIETEGGADGVDLSPPPTDLISIEAGVVDSLLSLNYLKDMSKAIPTDAEVIVELGEEFPVRPHYQIAERTDTITYMFTPRTQSD